MSCRLAMMTPPRNTKRGSLPKGEVFRNVIAGSGYFSQF
jgi:hypothetical protein